MAETDNMVVKASQDLRTIEDFVNLPADSEVYPRLLPSVNVGTLAGTRDAIFRAGGLPAEPFETKAQMEIDGAALADGQLAMVYNETANNGLYVKTAGAWVKSEYDPVSVSEKQRKLGENTVNDWYFYEPYYEKAAQALYFKPNSLSTSTPSYAFIMSDTRYGTHTVPYTTLVALLDSSTLVKTTSPDGVADCYVLDKNKAIFYDPINKVISVGTRIAPKNLITLIANNYLGIAPCTEYSAILKNMLDNEVRKSKRYSLDYRVQVLPSGLETTNGSFAVDYDTLSSTLNFAFDTIFYLNGNRYILTDAGGVAVDCSVGSTAIKVFFDIRTKAITAHPYAYNVPVADKEHIAYLATIRLRNGVHIDATFPWSVNGKMYGQAASAVPKIHLINNLPTSGVRSIAHRGYSTIAPENTLPAYILAKKNGFKYVETDIRYAKDGTPILMHDSTLDRTTNGTGSISLKTVAELQALDAGSWKNASYAGTKVPTLKEFLDLCRVLDLHPYLELKSASTANTLKVMEVVKDCMMQSKVTYISPTFATLETVVDNDIAARVSFVTADVSNNSIDMLVGLRTGYNQVVADFRGYAQADYDTLVPIMAYAKSQDIPVEVWTVNDAALAVAYAELGVEGITTDSLDVQSLIDAKYLA